MIRLLQFLVFGHWHKWKIINQRGYVDYANYVDDGKIMAKGIQYTLQCEKCGKLKEHKT